jgi:threonine dehydratase
MSAKPGEKTFPINQRTLSGGLAVSDAEALAAVAFAARELKLVLEPGGAVALAALLSGAFDARGRTVVVVLSGGNVDEAVFARALAGNAA